MQNTIYNLSNEDYHHSAPYTEYVSSSQLKLYRKSPAVFHHAQRYPQTTSSAAREFGSLFHKAMELFATHQSIDPFWESVAIFSPPINPKTEEPYGKATKAYAEAYELFLKSVGDKVVASQSDVATVDDMVNMAVNRCGDASQIIRAMMRSGKTEVSHFVEYEGLKFKYRPDLETPKRIVDWKATSLDSLNEYEINKTIINYGYHISAAFYQFFEHERTGIWKDFYLVFVSKEEPCDMRIVDMRNYGYLYMPDVDILIKGPGAEEFEQLLAMHIQCTKDGQWPGASVFNDNNPILEIVPPKYLTKKYNEETL